MNCAREKQMRAFAGLEDGIKDAGSESWRHRSSSEIIRRDERLLGNDSRVSTRILKRREAQSPPTLSARTSRPSGHLTQVAHCCPSNAAISSDLRNETRVL